MLKHLHLLALVCIVFATNAQTFDFKKEGKVISFSQGNSSMVFNAYKRIREGVSERKVTWNGASYTFTKWISADGEIEVVRDSTKRLLATTYLDGKSKYNITLPDGKTLVWVEDGRTLQYTHENKSQVECTVSAKGFAKTADLNIGNNAQISEGVTLLLMARASEKMKSGSGKSIWIGLAVMAAAATVIGTVMEPAPDVQQSKEIGSLLAENFNDFPNAAKPGQRTKAPRTNYQIPKWSGGTLTDRPTMSEPV